MQKTRQDASAKDGPEVRWEFPISEVEPKNLVIRLGRASTDEGEERVYMLINGLMRPNCIFPESGPVYVGEETKDPILYQLSQTLLDTVEAETKRTVRVSQNNIIKDYNHGADMSRFLVDTSSWLKLRRFSKAHADKLFTKLESVIDAKVTEIEARVAEATANRPALMQKKFALDDPETHHRHVMDAMDKAGLTVKPRIHVEYIKEKRSNKKFPPRL